MARRPYDTGSAHGKDHAAAPADSLPVTGDALPIFADDTVIQATDEVFAILNALAAAPFGDMLGQDAAGWNFFTFG